MKTSSQSLNRRDFTKSTLLAGAALASGALDLLGAESPARRIRTGVIGCGSVSNSYLPVLTNCPYAEVVSVCDIKPERAAQAVRLRELQDEACDRAARPGFPTSENGPFDLTAQTPSAILTADFNFPPENPAYDDIQKPLASGGPAYRDAWALLNGRRAHEPTFCVHDQRYAKEPYCCDFVFVSEDLAPRVRAVTVDRETKWSDHQPVLLDFDSR